MFSHPQGNYLKVYLDGYRKNSATQPPELEFIPGSFLDRHRDLDSYSSDSQDFWYLRLAGPATSRTGVSIPQLPGSSRSSITRDLSPPGSSASLPPGQDPIPDHTWKQRSEADRQSFTRGLSGSLG